MSRPPSIRALRWCAVLWLALCGLTGPASADAPTWMRTCPELAGRNVYDLVVSPMDGRRVLAASEIGVYRTSNGGDTWSEFSQGIGAVAVLRLTQHASAPWTVYAATEDRLYRWQEGQGAWQEITGYLPVSGSHIAGLAAAPSLRGRVYAVIAGHDHLLLVSHDGGVNWDQRAGNLQAEGWELPSAQPLGNSLVVAAYAPDLLIHARSPSLSQVLLTGDAGQFWSDVSLASDGVYALAMASDGAPWPSYAGTSGAGVYVRASADSPWAAVSTNLPGNGDDDVVRALTVHPAAAEHVLAGVDGQGVYQTVDGGTWWEPYGTGLPTNPTFRVYALRLGAGGGSLFWAATSDGVWHTVGTPIYLPVILREATP